MSLIFGSVFLFILISPGLLFRFSYLQGTYAKLNFSVSAVEEIFWAVVPTFFLHSVAILLIESLMNYSIRLDILYQLMIGETSDFEVVRKSLFPFLAYLAIVIAISIFSGSMLRFVIRKLRLDFYLSFLRLGHEWHYLLSGEILNYPKRNTRSSSLKFLRKYLKALGRPSKKIQWIQIDALMSSSEGDVIYSGILNEYYLSRDNRLDRIYLSEVYRRKFKKDLELDEEESERVQHLDDRYYSMPGDLFVIQYDKVLNLNITYYSDELEELLTG
jgi:hypothetical protein